MPGPDWFEPDAGEKAAIDEEIGSKKAAGDVIVDNGNSASAVAVSMAVARQKLTLTASAAVITLSGFPAAGTYAETTLELVQDGTGTRLLPSFVPAAHYGAAGAPTLSTAAGAKDVVKLSSWDGGTTVDVVLVEKGA